ncbi:helix-turn-helix domain-containing protein [Thermus altitudinis]|uniref:helix-turn-helix domain-containing protein n=1 Tax=Thermus altitudinis TaxID=2908145 RepID=UPI001FA9C499|nr:helix-turn-helix domain-containing protein [Thermus altitudinis]
MPFLVKNSLAARLLADPDMAVCLKPFMKGPASVKDLALAQGLSPQQAYYRVGLLLKAGLLQPAGLLLQRGRYIRLYRAVDTDFRIPRELVPERVWVALEGAQSWQEEWEKALELYDPGYGTVLRVFLNPEGILEFGSEGEPDILAEEFPPLVNLWSAGLHLRWEEAKAFQRELLALYHRYAALSPARKEEGQPRYLLHLGLAPAPK